MNDNPNPIGEFPVEAFVNPEVLKVAEGILQEVRAGRVTSLGCIVVGAMGIQARMAGQHMPIYLGADILKNGIMTQIMGPAPGPGKLIRPVA